jgi:hypothetical protein
MSSLGARWNGLNAPARRRLVLELRDGIRYRSPDGRALAVAGRRERIGARCALYSRPVSVALEQEVCRAPDVDLSHHAGQICARAIYKGLKPSVG